MRFDTLKKFALRKTFSLNKKQEEHRSMTICLLIIVMASFNLYQLILVYINSGTGYESCGGKTGISLFELGQTA